MKADRSIQILSAGLKAAHERMFSRKGPQQPEYPRNFDRLYGWAEDSLFALFEAVSHKDPVKTIESAGDIIVIMSEIVEYAQTAESLSSN
jgi:hypothetical protein